MKLLKNKKGVTLAELLAVITIMGIIAAIAIPAIGNVISNSRVGAAESDAVALYEAARVQCTVEVCSAAITDLGDYIDGSVGGTYSITVVAGKATEVVITYASGSEPDGTNNTLTYSPGSVVWSTV